MRPCDAHNMQEELFIPNNFSYPYELLGEVAANPLDHVSQDLLLSSYLTGADLSSTWQKGSQAKKASSGLSKNHSKTSSCAGLKVARTMG